MIKRYLFIGLLFMGFLFQGFAQETFSGHFIFDMTTYAEGQDKPQKSKMKCTVTGEKLAIEFLEQSGTKDEQLDNMHMVMVPQKEKMYMLMNQGGQKMGFKMTMPEDSFSQNQSDDVEVNVTDEMKTIRGYSCKKVIIIDDETKTTAWVTEDAEFNNSKIFMHQQATPMSGNKQQWEAEGVPVDGWTLEATGTNKQTGEKIYHYEIKEITEGEVDESLFDLSGYQMMDASMLKQMQQGK